MVITISRKILKIFANHKKLSQIRII